MIFGKSLMAGLCISIGCIAYLSVGGGALGAFLFSVGLMCVICFKFALFTGRVCYIEANPSDMVGIITILIGNVIMAAAVGTLVRFMKPELSVLALDISETKMAEGLWVIPLAMLCNFIIYFAVEAHRRPFRASSAITILCVMAFILCGFEHSIANTCYFAIGGTLFTGNGLLYIVTNIIWNAVGGLLIRRLDSPIPTEVR